jgi:thiamine pyrophosphokinase
VLCHGQPPPEPLLHYWLDGADIFLCTDGAGYPYTHLPRRPDVVIGDFDSLAGRVLEGRGGPICVECPEQDTTDAEKALLYLAGLDYAEAVLLGATGGRVDHTVHNLHLVERFADRLRVCVADPQHDIVRVGPGETVTWMLPPRTLFSLLPLAGPATGVTLSGARWPLANATLRAGGPATVSNRVAEPVLMLSVGAGSLLVTVQRQGWPATG